MSHFSVTGVARSYRAPERVVECKDLGWVAKGEALWVGSILDGLCRTEDFEVSSQR